MRFIQAIKAFWTVLMGREVQTSTPQKQKACKKENTHLQLLRLLQEEGRLIDFFQEDISSFSDAQVGAAVRNLHSSCKKIFEENVTIRPVMEAGEGQTIIVEAGYDPLAIKLVGNIKGDGPFSGRLIHAGWKAHKRSLPKSMTLESQDILQPAEIEVS